MDKWRKTEKDNQAGVIQTIKRVGKYSLARGASILIALMIGVYLCVLAANYGGFIDAIFNDLIENTIKDVAIYGNHAGETPEETSQKLKLMREQMREMYGLNEPFFNRSLRWYWRAITFDWGEAVSLHERGYFGDKVIPVRQMILEYLPRSLLLFGAANLTTFIIGILVALRISRKPGSLLNKIITALTPLFTAPSWVYALILWFILPTAYNAPPPNALIPSNFEGNFLDQLTIVLKSLAWPVAATFLSLFIQMLFTWRTFFALSALEHHVELATAMGLHPRHVERKHILRPTLLTVLTNFSMLLLAFWQSSLALELSFSWPGIGFLFIRAIMMMYRNLSIGILVTFAYMIAFTSFFLEFIYALVDPRVRMGGQQTLRKARPTVFRRTGDKPAWQTTGISRLFQRRRTPHPSLSGRLVLPRVDFKQSALLNTIRQITKSTMGRASLAIVLGLTVIAVVTVIVIPQSEAIGFWRTQREDTWRMPEQAQPAWTNFFREDKLAETLYLKEGNRAIQVSESALSETSWQKNFTIRIDYRAVTLPQDIKLLIQAEYEEKMPLIQITILTPDGRKVDLAEFIATSETLYPVGAKIAAEFSTSNRRFTGSPMAAIFTDPEDESQTVIQGEYQLQVRVTTFEEHSEIYLEAALLGDVYGLSGTDPEKHDLSIPLFWGLPVALVFGLAGAVLTSIATMLIAAVGAWYGGWVDGLIQRISEVNIMIPALPIAMTIYFSISKSIWVIMGVLVLLNIFSVEIKNYRAAFLQIKDLPYIEAAQAYGASNFQIIRRYLIPKIYPLLLPRLVFMVPAYVYLEATLAILGVTGVYLPTWGKMIMEGLINIELPYIFAQPVVFLLLTATAFTLLGISLEKILNPTLQDV